MRVHIVDPSAYTPPYDHALCAALAARGAQVKLFTSRFAYSSLPEPQGFERKEFFYRGAVRLDGARARRAAKLAEHVPDMLRYRRAARSAEVVHFQWLTVQHLDGILLPPRRANAGAGGAGVRPRVLTAHDILPREPRPGQLRAQRRLYDRFDAVVVHSEHGRARLTGELGVDPRRVHVIPHGAFAHLADPYAQHAPPPPFRTDVPVVLCFGLMRPYKGIDVLLEAWRGIDGAELWVVGMPRMDISALVAAAPRNVRFVPRFISGAELAAFFMRADLVVLPYREIDQSGVLFTALAFGKPLLLSDVGGFPEVASAGAAALFAQGDVPALHGALTRLIGDERERARLAAGARTAAAGPFSWSAAARRTLALYARLREG